MLILCSFTDYIEKYLNINLSNKVHFGIFKKVVFTLQLTQPNDLPTDFQRRLTHFGFPHYENYNGYKDEPDYNNTYLTLTKMALQIQQMLRKRQKIKTK